MDAVRVCVIAAFESPRPDCASVPGRCRGAVHPRLRWPRKIGQEVKLGSPLMEDGPDDGQTEAVWRGFQGEGCS